MGTEFTVFKGSASGDITEAKGSREPKPTEVIVKISHCGVCGTDEHYRHADMGLGHEGVGVITEVGSSVHDHSHFRVGDRVGMAWFHKTCGHCKPCLTGRQNACVNATYFGSADFDQGCFGTAVAWDISTLYKIPDAIASENAGPLMCGGATVWGPLYDGIVKPGGRVGILGVGGLGHLAIQFASKLGFEPIVFSGTEEKRGQAMELGATEFHVTSGVEKFEGIEPIDALLVTTNVMPNMAPYFGILERGGKIVPLTASMEKLPITPIDLISTNVSVVGSGGATVSSIQSMLAFAAKNEIKPMIEKFPLTQKGVVEAMQKLRDGKMRYRAVLVAV